MTMTMCVRAGASECGAGAPAREKPRSRKNIGSKETAQ
jgi:hypothetical protein